MSCEKECGQKESSGPMNEFATCLESEDPFHSVEKWCSDYMETSWERIFCSRDMCQACCVTMPLQLGKNVDTKEIEIC